MVDAQFLWDPQLGRFSWYTVKGKNQKGEHNLQGKYERSVNFSVREVREFL